MQLAGSSDRPNRADRTTPTCSSQPEVNCLPRGRREPPTPNTLQDVHNGLCATPKQQHRGHREVGKTTGATALSTGPCLLEVFFGADFSPLQEVWSVEWLDVEEASDILGHARARLVQVFSWLWAVLLGKTIECVGVGSHPCLLHGALRRRCLRERTSTEESSVVP